MKICEANPLPRLIYQTSLGLQGHADELLRPYDLTLEQFHSLKILLIEGGSVGQRDLCALTTKTPANLTRILDRLALKEFIERQPDPKDRRAFIINLTNTGERLINELMVIFSSYLDQILANITPDDTEACLRVLAQIMANLNQIVPNTTD